jgi:hypothetical protein
MCLMDFETLVATRGPNFPLSRLESRLMCPACGNRRVTVVFDRRRIVRPLADDEKPFARAHLDVDDSVSLVSRYLGANDFESEVICQPVVR